MASITATTRAVSTTTQVDVTLVSLTVIADPSAYVAQAAQQAKILAQAGLDADLDFIAAVVTSSTSIAGTSYTYILIVSYGDVPESATSHTHDATSVTVTLTDAYLAGSSLTVDATYGPMIIQHEDDSSVDYLRIRTDTATTPRDLLWVKQGSILRVGAHTEYYTDATYDIGTPDGGSTLRRPRDVRLSRNLYAGGDAAVTGFGSFGSYVLATNSRFTAQSANPDASPTSRHVYVNSVDDSLRYWDGSSDNVISGGAGTSGDTVGLYNCAAGMSVGSVVVVSSTDTVIEANATTLAGKSITGVVVSKPTSTTCNVKYIGETGAVFAGALTPGKEYRVARTDGGITDNLVGFTEGDTDQIVGVAKDADTLVIGIGAPSIL